MVERQRPVGLDEPQVRSRSVRARARGAPSRRARHRPRRRRRRAAPRRSGRCHSRGRAPARRGAPRRAAGPAGAPTPTARDPAARPPRRTRSGRARPRGYAAGDAAAADPSRDRAALDGRKTLLVDPMLDAAGARPPVAETPSPRDNPLVELPEPAERVVQGIDAVLVTHLHQDHLDATAIRLLPKDVPLFCAPGDADALRGHGFTECARSTTPPTGTACRSPGRTASTVRSGRRPASSIGSLYIAGDTVWCDEVRGRARHAPARGDRRQRRRRALPRGRPAGHDRRRRRRGRTPRARRHGWSRCTSRQSTTASRREPTCTSGSMMRGSPTASRCRRTAPRCRWPDQYVTATMLARPTGKRKGRSCIAVVRDRHHRCRARRGILGARERGPPVPPGSRRRRGQAPAGVRRRRRGAQLRPRRRAAVSLAAGAEPPDPLARAPAGLRAAAADDPPRRADRRGQRAARSRAPPARRSSMRRSPRRSRSAASWPTAWRRCGRRCSRPPRPIATSRRCARRTRRSTRSSRYRRTSTVTPVTAGGVPSLALGVGDDTGPGSSTCTAAATSSARPTGTGRWSARWWRPPASARSCRTTGSRPSTRSPPRSRTH